MLIFVFIVQLEKIHTMDPLLWKMKCIVFSCRHFYMYHMLITLPLYDKGPLV